MAIEELRNSFWDISSREALTKDTVNTIEVRAVAIRDHSEGRSGLVVAHENLVNSREAAKVRAISVVEIESLGRLSHEGGGPVDVEVARVGGTVWLVEKLVRVPLIGDLELTVPHPCRTR
jgi:uncharacterized protein YcbX